MNKLLMLTLLSMCILSPAFTKQKKCLADKCKTPVTQIVSLLELNETMVKNILEENHPEIAIECAQGTELPLKYLGNFGSISLHFDPNATIRLEEKCYFRMIKSKKSKSPMPYISFNLTNWEKFSSYLNGKTRSSFGVENQSFVSVKTAIEKKSSSQE